MMDTRSLANLHLSFAGVVYNLGITAKIGCLLLSMFFMLSFLFDPLKPLGVTPGYLIPPNFWIWTLITHPFIETNTILFICSIAFVVVGSNALEGSFGTTKLSIYYGIVCVSSAVLSALFYLFLYMLTFNIDFLFAVHVNGIGGLLGGALVAIKQAYGDHLVIGAIGLEVKDVPLLGFLVLIPLKLTGFFRGSYLLAYSFGAITGWIYLRFYQNHSRGRGDQSEKFAFKYFFPVAFQGPIGLISDIIYNFLLKLRICRKTVYRYDVGAPSNITLTLSGVNALDAERRRNKAIKALDERLKKSTSDSSAAAWPSLNDDDEGEESSEKKQIPSTNEISKNGHESSSADGSASPDIVTIDMDSPSGENNS
ncbi:transmembrane protein 115-like [Styela clava]